MNDWLGKFLWGSENVIEELKQQYPITIEGILKQCQFGFQLRNDGKYCAVVKSSHEIWNDCSLFVNYLRRTTDCHININFSLFFETLTEPDCNNFAKHTHLFSVPNEIIEKDQKQLDLIASGYKESITEIPNDSYKHYYYTKILSVDEFKELLISRVHEYFKDHEEEIKNKQKFQREGAVFVECR